MDDQPDVRLVEACSALADELRAYAEEFARAGQRHFLQRYPLNTPVGVAEVVALLRRQSKGLDLGPGLVPQTTYFLLRADGRLLGTSRLRHHLNEELEIEGGHIGYDVRPSERRRGHGTTILALTLEKARERGITRVLVTCDDDNVASGRIIEKNGGLLLDRVRSPESAKLVRRYWIELAPLGVSRG